MIFSTLLAAAIEGIVGVLAEVGMGGYAQDLKEKLLKRKTKQRIKSLNQAYQNSLDCIDDIDIAEKLKNPELQEKFTSALLDPSFGFNLNELKKIFADEPTVNLAKIQSFFAAIQNTLLADEYWGPVLERFHNIYFCTEVQKALAAKKIQHSPEKIIHQLKAKIEGSGAVAQGGSIAVGENAEYAGRDITHIINVFVKELFLTSGEKSKLAGSAGGRIRYMKQLRRYCQILPLAALGGEEGGKEEISLDNVYIELDTTTPEYEPRQELYRSITDTTSEDLLNFERFREKKENVLSALEAAQKYPKMVLLGDPGAGKSTFAKKILGWLAAAHLEEIEPPLGFRKDLVPIYLPLSDLSGRLANIEIDRMSGDKQRESMAKAVKEQIISDLSRYDASDFASTLEESLIDGHCFIVLDGLDEVPMAMREKIKIALQSCLLLYKIERILITCRIRSYYGDAIVPSFESFTLAPLNQEKISSFSQAWYHSQVESGRFSKAEANEKSKSLENAALSADLIELARNPMLLTTMAIIHQKEIGLPKERVRLYKLAVEVLLRRWQKRKFGDREYVISSDLARIIDDDTKIKNIMERIAYEAHCVGGGQKGSSELDRGYILTLLEKPECIGSLITAKEFLDYIDQRAGLFIGRGSEPGMPNSYSFPHRTFQEYLAGCYISRQRDRDRLYYTLAGEGDSWSLAAYMGAEELHYNDRFDNSLLDLAYSLCPGKRIEKKDFRPVLWSGKIAALLSKEFIERDTESKVGGRRYLDRLIPNLTKVMRFCLSPVEKAEAGVILAQLGDPREEVMTIDKMEFCFVPGGPFFMGDKASGGNKIFEALSDDYWISRFPVTNAQYTLFMKDGGYQNKAWWLEAMEEKFWKGGKFKDRYDDEYRDRPYDFGSPYNLDNHPVVGVSWFEALAFTRWLTARWQQEDHLPGGMKVGLPSEAEWEKAARGGMDLPRIKPIKIAEVKSFSDNGKMVENKFKERVYPWGDKKQASLGNFEETQIKTTSAVGCFPQGAGPYGCEEMSGNVWEWTRSLYKDYPYVPGDGREKSDAPSDKARVLRGGSDYFPIGLARCSDRIRGLPYNWFRFFGFRLVLSLFNSDL
jgi:formylglycine-generating enzyme required for sulfatase activity